VGVNFVVGGGGGGGGKQSVFCAIGK